MNGEKCDLRNASHLKIRRYVWAQVRGIRWYFDAQKIRLGGGRGGRGKRGLKSGRVGPEVCAPPCLPFQNIYIFFSRNDKTKAYKNSQDIYKYLPVEQNFLNTLPKWVPVSEKKVPSFSKWVLSVSRIGCPVLQDFHFVEKKVTLFTQWDIGFPN